MTDKISTKRVIDHFISTIVGKIEDLGGEDRRGLTDKEEGLLDGEDIFHLISHGQPSESIEQAMLFARMNSRKKIKRQYKLDLRVVVKYLIPLSFLILTIIMSYLIFMR
jgi:hypothetical protein